MNIPLSTEALEQIAAMKKESVRANGKSALPHAVAESICRCNFGPPPKGWGTKSSSGNQSESRLNSDTDTTLSCPKCKAVWPTHYLDGDADLARVNYCRHCAEPLWTTLPCGHDTPVSDLPYNFCGECGQSTGLVSSQAPLSPADRTPGSTADRS
jgi:hypothetical protein